MVGRSEVDSVSATVSKAKKVSVASKIANVENRYFTRILKSVDYTNFSFSVCVLDRTCVVSVFGSRAFPQACFSFGFWGSGYVPPHGSCYTVPLNLTSVRCRSACRFRGGPPLRMHHTVGIGIRRLVRQISALLSTYPIGDTDGNVPSLLFPNTFAPTASDTIS